MTILLEKISSDCPDSYTHNNNYHQLRYKSSLTVDAKIYFKQYQSVTYPRGGLGGSPWTHRPKISR